MRDDDYLLILRCGNAEIVIAPQPPPVSDVDPAIIADMKARLAGKDQAVSAPIKTDSPTVVKC